MDTDPDSPKRPLVEWIIAALSAVAVALLVGFLAYQAVFGDTRPATLTILSHTVERLPHGALVRVEIANVGDRAAEGVRVMATAPAAGPEAEKQIEFDYLAPRSVRRGAFSYSRAIDPAEIEIAIHGYVEP